MTGTATRVEAPVQELEVAAYTVPTDAPEADGTLAWQETTIVVVQARANGERGLGFTYADVSTAKLVQSKLAGVVEGADAMSPQASWLAMVGQIRNLGRPGIASMAIAAVDLALWDLKARLLGLPLCQLLGMAHDRVPVYGSGGFTAYSMARLQEQLAGWVEQGIPRVKMKVGSDPEEDPARVGCAREAIGPETELFVDANGGYSRKQALELAQRFRAEADVSWFEEPVSSDDLEGLRLLRDRAPAGMAITAGEYGYDVPYFRRMLSAGAVDVQQADVTRCAGITELLRVDGLCRAHG
jgi:L-alanine-DL-glutamate epimerase-like enolase superfamily enzyme